MRRAGAFDPDAQKRGLPRPWVQLLIFLAGANLDVNLTAARGMHVVTRRNFREAITRGEFPGAPDRLRQLLDDISARSFRACTWSSLGRPRSSRGRRG